VGDFQRREPYEEEHQEKVTKGRQDKFMSSRPGPAGTSP
jgi:hypothetical protein